MTTHHTFGLHPTRHGSAAIMTCIVLAGCSTPSRDLTTSDWCWLHHRLAPPGALAFDAGPDSSTDAVIWDAWLNATADAPADRRGLHDTQRRLIDRFVQSGGWSDGERERYRSSAQAEPTPSTVCETVGARIAVGDDGSVPPGWKDRFLDPNNPAYSRLASDEGLDR